MLKNTYRILTKKGISVLCLFTLLLSFPGFVISEGGLSIRTIPHEAQVEQQWEDRFYQQVQGWIKQISAREPNFNTWETAKWESYPFGPGSKQWIILILDRGEEIGYLIIGEENGELLLIEYGKSEEAVLSRAVEKKELAEEDFIYSGLLWGKNEKNIVVDLITNEAYEHVPIELVIPYWSGEMVKSLQLNHRFSAEEGKEAILFYKQLKVNKDSSEATHFEASHSYFFQTELLPQVTALYNVLGIHYWDWNPISKDQTGLFVGLSDEGVRFLSFRYLNQIGHFYEMP